MKLFGWLTRFIDQIESPPVHSCLDRDCLSCNDPLEQCASCGHDYHWHFAGRDRYRQRIPQPCGFVFDRWWNGECYSAERCGCETFDYPVYPPRRISASGVGDAEARERLAYNRGFDEGIHRGRTEPRS